MRSAVMFVAGAILLVIGAFAGFRLATMLEEHQPLGYAFGVKTYWDFGGDAVYITGTRTGEGVDYPDNATQITCLQSRMTCVVNSIDGIGKELCQLGRLEMANELPVTEWTDTEIVASEEPNTMGCRFLTISISRREQAAVLVDRPTNITSALCRGASASTYKSTLEDSPFEVRLRRGLAGR